MYRPRNEEPEKKKRSRASYRNIDNLFSESVTVHCALEGRCVPCAYKIGNFDVALDDDFTRAVPNQRPEMCPRAKGGVRCPRLGTLGFRRGMNILTVGDGDFSFSVAVLRLLYHKGSLDGQIVATSYEDRQTLERVYPNVRKHLDELERCGADILFEVDATKLRESSVTANDAARRFDRIVWNFPCTAIESGKDGQNDEMDANKELVGMFVSEARHMLLDVSGEILMCHKTKPPFNQWNFAEVAIKESNDEDPVVEYRGRVVLDRFTLPPYTPRKALDRKSFPCHDACYYVFGLTGRNERNPPTIPVQRGARESPTISCVSQELIECIRTTHLDRKTSLCLKKRRSSADVFIAK